MPFSLQGWQLYTTLPKPSRLILATRSQSHKTFGVKFTQLQNFDPTLCRVEFPPKSFMRLTPEGIPGKHGKLQVLV